MQRILILFAHPRFEHSRTNTRLVQQIRGKTGVTFHDLYERYPDFNIDVPYEKRLLEEHDVIIWQHPFYWYSCPPLMKQWIDLVLEFGWAYGSQGNALKNKRCLSVITAGGTLEAYCAEGDNNYSIKEFLRPFEQTARLCGMEYLPPFAVLGTHKVSIQELDDFASQYERLLDFLQEEPTGKKVNNYKFLKNLQKRNSN